MENPYDAKQQAVNHPNEREYFEYRTQPAMSPQAVGDSCGRLSTISERAEKMFYFHTGEADKARHAVEFFQKNPAFMEFLELVRSGAINIHG